MGQPQFPSDLRSHTPAKATPQHELVIVVEEVRGGLHHIRDSGGKLLWDLGEGFGERVGDPRTQCVCITDA